MMWFGLLFLSKEKISKLSFCVPVFVTSSTYNHAVGSTATYMYANVEYTDCNSEYAGDGIFSTFSVK